VADELLSQEEIDALLRGSSSKMAPSQNGEDLTPEEKDILGEIGNISMGSAATTLSTLLNKKVEITTPVVSVRTVEEFEESFPEPAVLFKVNFVEGITGAATFVLKERDALVVGDLMMGGDGVSNLPDAINELYQSAVSEAMNQMMGAAATSISSMLGRKVNIAPPEAKPIDLSNKTDLFPDFSLTQRVVTVHFKMEIEGILETEFSQIMPVDFAKELCRSVSEAMSGEGAQEVSGEQPVSTGSVSEEPPRSTGPSLESRAPVGGGAVSSSTPVAQPVQFAPLSQAESISAGPKNIDLILDVPVKVSVELGETKMLIRDILALSPGALVELNKLAGEPVDILVNGRVIARGEVVVIDENFGVRITAIVTPQERIERMRKSLE